MKILFVRFLLFYLFFQQAHVNAGNYNPKPANNYTQQQNQIANREDDAQSGASLFQSRGCHACHTVDSPHLPWKAGKPGPELLKISAKVNQQWLVSWIRNPKLIHSNTLMPEFGERDRGLTHQEADAITAYLLNSSSKLNYSPQALAYDRSYHPTAKSVEFGRRIFESRGCLGCHDLGKKKAAAARHVPLDGAGLKLTPAWLYTWLENPKQVSTTTTMPDFSLQPHEIRCLSDFIMSLTKPEIKYPLFVTDAENELQTDKHLAEKSGCYACHEISWLAKTKSDPRKAFAVDQATMFFGPGKYSNSDIQKGKSLIAKYGCYACHLIPGFKDLCENFGPDLSEFADRDPRLLFWGSESIALAEQNRNWQSWTEIKISNPKAFESTTGSSVMPNFHLSPSEIAKLTAFMRTLNASEKALTNKSATSIHVSGGEQILHYYGCTGCHSLYDETRKQSTAFHKEPQVNYGKLAPNLSPEGQRVRLQWLIDYLNSPYKMRPYLPTVMPTFNLKDSDKKALINYFRAKEGKVPGKTTLTDEQMPKEAQTCSQRLSSDIHVEKQYFWKPDPKKGETLLAQMQCTSCHQIGGKELQSTNPLHWYKNTNAARRFAPDLRFAEERLNNSWMNSFLENPHNYIPDTTMPYAVLSTRQIAEIRSYLKLCQPVRSGSQH